MKVSVGKSVDCEYVAVFCFQPALEIQQVWPIRKFICGVRSEAQADGVRFIRAYGLAYAQNVVLKGCKGFLPIATAMNVGAIREVYVVSEMHAFERRF